MTDILTRSVDAARSGANTAESVLTPAAVAARGVTLRHTLAIPDDPRLEAQPLYVSGIEIQGQVRNVIYQASMGNTVYAFDADAGTPLWSRTLGVPVNGSGDIDSHNINVRWGILSTPVIDRAAGRLYACAWVSVDGSGDWRTAQHFAAALDLATGGLAQPLLNLEGVTYTLPSGAGTPQVFRSAERKQRAGLALVSGAVIICFGTIAETAQSARGWVIAVDTARWGVAAAWCSACRGSGGGIWMSGAAPAIQGDGSIWVATGNGDFDGVSDFGESVVKLTYTPPAAAGGTITVAGWWTPWTDAGRTSGNPEGEGDGPAHPPVAHTLAADQKDAPMPTNFRLGPQLLRQGRLARDMGVTDAMGNPWGDQDLGASGVVLVEALGVALVSGKDGILYTVSLAAPGDTRPADLSPAAAAANYAKLASPPILYTYFDPDINPGTTSPATLNVYAKNVTHHLHGTPVAWTSGAHELMHFCGGENGNLRAWSLGASKASTYLGCSVASASPQAPVPGGGMPGWSLTLSADGARNGVVWGMIPYRDANMELTPGRLLAYDAQNLQAFADGGGEIAPLWDSQQWGWDFLHPKFNRPIAVDGQVIVPTYDGRLLVLGLS